LRSGTPLAQGAKPYRVFQGNHRLYVLVSPRGRLPSPCSRRRAPAAVCARQGTAPSNAFGIGAIVDLLAGAVSIALGFRGVLYFWLLPALLAPPLLRALLIVEHTGCSQDGNGLTNTRTTLTSFPIRLLMWNMPYHAEHHCIRRSLFTNYRRCA
jgi:fatty acid desaturase